MTDEQRQKKRKSIEKKIDHLRNEHTRLFNAQDTDPNAFQKMDTIIKKIVMYWDQWHRLG